MPYYGGTNDLSVIPPDYVIPSGPASLIIQEPPHEVLTAGSDLTVVAQSGGPMPSPGSIIGTFMRRLFKGSWRMNKLQEVQHRNLPGNYGAISSRANFSYLGRQYDQAANSPMWIRTPKRPTYNVATPILYRLRVEDPLVKAQSGDLIQVPVVQIGPATFVPAAVASLQETVL
jgi:hypothetical protein